MGKKTPSVPPPPDPAKTIAAQGAANKDALLESARINAVDIYSPTGSVTYDRSPDGIPYAQHINVSPVVNDTIGRQELIGNNLTRIAGVRTFGIPLNDFDISQAPYGRDSATGLLDQMTPMGDQRDNMPYDPRAYGDLDMYRNQVQDAFMDQQRRNLEPVFAQQYDREVQNLANRGLPVGGEAYNTAMSNLNRDQSNAWQNASNQAILAAGQEADRRIAQEQSLRGTAMSEAFNNQRQNMTDLTNILGAQQGYRGQAIAEDTMARNQNINEIAMLLGGAPSMPLPQANPLPSYQLQAPDVVGATMGAYSAQMQGYNAQAAQSGSAWQGAANVAKGLGSLAMKCSEAFKVRESDADHRTLDKVRDLRISKWRYKRSIDPRQELHIGPMAEDWQRIMGLGDGEHINVIDAFGVTLKCIQELNEDNRQMRMRIAELERRLG